MTATNTARPKWTGYEPFKNARECHVNTFIDGEEYFQKIAKEIQSTKNEKHFIYILGWMLNIEFEFRVDGRTYKFMDLLDEAASRGVEIKILIWDNPFYMKVLRPFFKREHKLQRKYNNVSIKIIPCDFRPKKSQLIVKQISETIDKFYKKNKNKFYLLEKIGGVSQISDFLSWAKRSDYSISSHHEKVILVNGEFGFHAYCGGIDINPNRVSTVKKIKSIPAKISRKAVHDLAIGVDGEAAKLLLANFSRRWVESSTENGDVMQFPRKFEIAKNIKKIALPGADERALVTVIGTHYYPIKNPDRSFRLAYETAIGNAQRSIYIEGQYVTNLHVARLLNKTIAKLKGNKFEVFIGTQESSEARGDVFTPNRQRAIFINILVKGLNAEQRKRISYAVIDKSKRSPHTAFVHKTQHSKVIIVDDEIAIIGSANLNNRGSWIENESSLVIINPAYALKLRLTLLLHTVLSKEKIYRKFHEINRENFQKYLKLGKELRALEIKIQKKSKVLEEILGTPLDTGNSTLDMLNLASLSKMLGMFDKREMGKLFSRRQQIIAKREMLERGFTKVLLNRKNIKTANEAIKNLLMDRSPGTTYMRHVYNSKLGDSGFLASTDLKELDLDKYLAKEISSKLKWVSISNLILFTSLLLGVLLFIQEIDDNGGNLLDFGWLNSPAIIYILFFLAAAVYGDIISEVNEVIRSIIGILADNGMQTKGLPEKFLSKDFSILAVSESELEKGLPIIFDFVLEHIGDPIDPQIKI